MSVVLFFYSRRRRHTRCALVTGVQTCALPILVAALPPEGIAILNTDDPLVWAMREDCQARIGSYGFAEGADLQAYDIQGDWPQRLSFTVRHKGEEHRVETQFCGRHWVTSTLAALATGVAAGVPLAQAVKIVSTVKPARDRKSTRLNSSH